MPSLHGETECSPISRISCSKFARGEDGQAHGELAEKLQITPATITRMIQCMEKSGFVQRQSDANDQCIARVYLTEAGNAIRAELEAVWDRMEVDCFAGFSRERTGRLTQLPAKIRENLTFPKTGKSKP